TRTSDVDRGDPVGIGKRIGDDSGQVARLHSGVLGQPHRDIRGVVPVLSHLRSLDKNIGRHRPVELYIAPLDKALKGLADDGTESLGCRSPSLSSPSL